jgi:hypothetical protein
MAEQAQQDCRAKGERKNKGAWKENSEARIDSRLTKTRRTEEEYYNFLNREVYGKCYGCYD